VTVRPTGIGKAIGLERLLNLIYAPEGPGRPSDAQLKSTFVLCLGDFSIRGEEIFEVLQSFFQYEDKDKQESGDMGYIQSSSSLDVRMEARDRLDAASEAMNFAANSQTLCLPSPSRGPVDLTAARLAELKFGGEDTIGGLSMSIDSPVMLKKTPSEPDLQVGEAEPDVDMDDSEAPSNQLFFTCTVHRKATRAAYHLSDTNDVAFLIAQLARELRQARLAGNSDSEMLARSHAATRVDAGHQSLFRTSSEGMSFQRTTSSESPRPPGRMVGGGGSYPGLTSLVFEP